tara:strand:- start:1003 stop:1233 length:231 start_codon:yes stop_codon:yes gene_type:complete
MPSQNNSMINKGLKMEMQPELKVQMELDAHEKECAIRYQAVNDKLSTLDKRMWRIEAMSMVGTLGVVALVVAIVMK